MFDFAVTYPMAMMLILVWAVLFVIAFWG